MIILNIIIFLINFSQFTILSKGQIQDCSSAKTCGKCISTSPNCFWCEDQKFGNSLNRCNKKQQLQDLNCATNKIIELKNEVTIIQDNNFAETIGATIQLKPQKYKISIRAHSEVKIPIQFRQADDYPMDLYYLMDLSCTMKKHKRNLANVGKRVADKIKKTTKNFHIGFGSFVDKTVMPYCAYKIEPLECERSKGEKPYSFTHRMSLNSNETEFVERVSRADTSGNTDSPEGTLDALMQVIVCKDEIGWRDQSDKIVVVATDEEFHYAGDGKLGGIVVPNDGKCHMFNNNYTHWEEMDYPSMHQIAEKVRENKFNIVFSVHNKVENIYDTLVKIIGSTARTAELKEDDNTVVELIDKVYKAIRSSVELRTEKSAHNIQIELFSDCSENNYMKTTKCQFKGKPVITFDAKIKMKSCPEDKSQWNQVIKIGLANINESVEIDLQMLCECDCEKPGKAIPNSNECSSAGTLSCGICSSCNGIRTGDKCQCDPEKPINASDPESHCKNKGDARTCSGRGYCLCAKCHCSERSSGDYCEFDDSNCYQNGIKCNGDNGNCFQGKCECTPQYSGNLCECPKSNITCIAPNSTAVCSDKGDCRCGKCDCRKSSSRGVYCQKCPSCESELFCDQIINCVPQICEQLRNKQNCSESSENSENCIKLNYKIVQQLDELSNSSLISIFRYQCQKRTADNDCDIIFTYERIDSEDDDQQLRFTITKANRICAQKADLVVGSISIIAGVILVGLALLLIWKLITEILDRKEFARFQKELNKANWDQSENPLYKEVSSTFTNPTFGLREKSTKK